MAYVRRELPVLSWSHRRDQTLVECPQLYYLRYYAAHNGWERNAPVEARQAYVLGKLSSLSQAVGMALHRRAAERVAALVAGDPLPGEGVMLNRCRVELNQLYLSSRRRDAFLRDPKNSPMLLEMYYGGEITAEQLERARTKLRTCVAHLARSAVWDELRSCLDVGGEVLVIDSLRTFELDGLEIYAAPDLVFRGPANLPWTIVDWKTALDWDGDTSQVAGYGLLVRDSLGWPLVDGRFAGRIVCLGSGGDHNFWLDAEDLVEAERRTGSASRMRVLLADPIANRPLPWDAYRLNWRPWRCRHCSYPEVCRDRILAEIRDRAGDAA